MVLEWTYHSNNEEYWTAEFNGNRATVYKENTRRGSLYGWTVSPSAHYAPTASHRATLQYQDARKAAECALLTGSL